MDITTFQKAEEIVKRRDKILSSLPRITEALLRVQEGASVDLLVEHNPLADQELHLTSLLPRESQIRLIEFAKSELDRELERLSTDFENL